MAAAGGPTMKVGAVEDAAKWGDPQAKMDLARDAGFDTVRLTAQWTRGLTAPSATDLAQLQAAASAALADGIEPVIAIYNAGSSSTPSDDTTRGDFVQYATAVVTGLPTVTRFIIGNEPNSNLYWLPQFNPDGSDAAAPAYEALLGASYDAIKAARPDAVVIGGALDPHGNDDPESSKQTHSPTSFIRDLGAAYRSSGRAAPLMDVFDMHVYADNSSLPPSMEHPDNTIISLADYPKLVSLLGAAFDGTAQAGSSLPILYGEFGVDSAIPPENADLYTGVEPVSVKPVDEATQARYYAEAFKLAYCQPNVIGILVFHVSDEPSLAAWQSGTHYSDDTPKSSLPAIRDAADAVRAGTATACPDTTPPSVAVTAPAAGTRVGSSGATVSVTASDDIGVGKVELIANGVVVAAKYAAPYTFTWTPKASGTYTLSARAQDAARNVGTSTSVSVRADVAAPPSGDSSAKPAPAPGPPETTIAWTPGPNPWATLSFASSGTGATFRCTLDGAPSACMPAAYARLAPGTHTFTVAAVDAAGNVDPTPASITWTVVGTPGLETTITSGPAGTVSAKNASFVFGASERATFECSLDGAAYASCTAPLGLAGLADGSHTFAVRATDAAGDVDPTPATRSWTVRSGRR
jgi:hypothetical protein